MALNIKMLDTVGSEKAFGLIAGPAGIGKTSQAVTFPRESTLIISIEDGLLSIAGSGYASEEVKNYNRVIEILRDEIPANAWIKYVYIDSLTEIYDLIKSELKSKYKPSQNFQKHDDMYDLLIMIIRLARQLPQTVFFTCHTKEDKNGIGLEENLAFDGKLPENVKKQFDLVLHMKSVVVEAGKEPVRCFVTSPVLSKIAKARISPFLGITLEDYEEPNIYKLTQKITGNNA